MCLEEDLKLKEELAKTFLEIARKLLPGISRLKGHIKHLHLSFFTTFLYIRSNFNMAYTI